MFWMIIAWVATALAYLIHWYIGLGVNIASIGLLTTYVMTRENYD